ISDGGNAGGTESQEGYAGKPGNLIFDSVLIQGTTAFLSFTSLKGTGRNSNTLSDGNVLITGCNLLNLTVSSCNSGLLEVNSNDSEEFMAQKLSFCSGTITTGLNPECPGKTKGIFSLTGRVTDFQGNELTGYLSELVLSDESKQIINSNPGQKNFFKPGLFNFSFGKNKDIFSASDLLLSFPFTYFLDFKLHTSTPSVFDAVLQEELILVSGQDEKTMVIPFEGKVWSTDSGYITNIKIYEIIELPAVLVFNSPEKINFSNGNFSSELTVLLKQNTLHKITFDVCSSTSSCQNKSFDFFTWKELG
ncbi:hypothetical protein KKG83_03515, partial [Candidatus Micrarchaeota archaeon]|nr:hypothetical protein [Candidatus Micrarchaeota archaeon]